MVKAIVYKFLHAGKVIYIGSYQDKRYTTAHDLLRIRLNVHKTYYKVKKNVPVYAYITCLFNEWLDIEVEVIEFFETNSKVEVRQKEQEYIDHYGLNNLYNVTRAYTSASRRKENIKNWRITNKKKMQDWAKEYALKNSSKYSCAACGYCTSYSSHFKKHINSKAHKSKVSKQV